MPIRYLCTTGQYLNPSHLSTATQFPAIGREECLVRIIPVNNIVSYAITAVDHWHRIRPLDQSFLAFLRTPWPVSPLVWPFWWSSRSSCNSNRSPAFLGPSVLFSRLSRATWMSLMMRLMMSIMIYLVLMRWLVRV